MVRQIRLALICLVGLALLSSLVRWGLVRNGGPGPSEAEAQQTDTSPNTSGGTALAEPNGFSHESPEACGSRHESDVPDETKARELARQVPTLCYRCHEDESKTFPYVHGPVAVGQCLFCHDPHESKYANLLKRDALQLCVLCHTRVGLTSIPNHVEPSHANCLECHTSHASHEQFLLKDRES